MLQASGASLRLAALAGQAPWLRLPFSLRYFVSPCESVFSASSVLYWLYWRNVTR